MTVHALEQEREDVLKRRQDSADSQDDLDPHSQVFIDEASLSTKMARLRGRALLAEHWKCWRSSWPLETHDFHRPLELHECDRILRA